MHHASKLWLNPVHQCSMQCIHGSLMCIRHQCGCASCINVAVHHASMWLCIMHQYGSMLCIHSSIMCIGHQYVPSIHVVNAVHQASLWDNIMIQCCCASVYGPMLCIRHHNMAQTCMCIIIYIARYSASRTQGVHHPSIQMYGSLQHDSSH